MLKCPYDARIQKTIMFPRGLKIETISEHGLKLILNAKDCENETNLISRKAFASSDKAGQLMIWADCMTSREAVLYEVMLSRTLRSPMIEKTRDDILPEAGSRKPEAGRIRNNQNFSARSKVRGNRNGL